MKLTKFFLSKGVFFLALIVGASFSTKAQVGIDNSGSCGQKALSASYNASYPNTYDLLIESDGPANYELVFVEGATVNWMYRDYNNPRLFRANITATNPGVTWAKVGFKPSGCWGWNPGNKVIFQISSGSGVGYP